MALRVARLWLFGPVRAKRLSRRRQGDSISPALFITPPPHTALKSRDSQRQVARGRSGPKHFPSSCRKVIAKPRFNEERPNLNNSQPNINRPSQVSGFTRIILARQGHLAHGKRRIILSAMVKHFLLPRSRRRLNHTPRLTTRVSFFERNLGLKSRGLKSGSIHAMHQTSWIKVSRIEVWFNPRNANSPVALLSSRH